MTVPNGQNQDGQNQDGQNQDGQNQDGQNQDGQNQDPFKKRVGDVTFSVPEEYKAEKWAQGMKTPDDVWKTLANAEKLIGRKGVIQPAKDAPQTEWDAFYNAQGRPENPEGYEFKTLDELKHIERNPTTDNAIKNLLHKHGLPKDKAEQLVADYEKLTYEMHKPAIEKAVKVEKEFNALTQEVFGKEKEATMAKFKSVLKDVLGDKAAIASKLDSLDNDALLTVLTFTKKIHDTYVGEHRIPAGSGNVGNLTGDLRSDFNTLSEQKIRIKIDPALPEHVRQQKIAHINSQMLKLGQRAADEGVDLFVKP